MKIAAVEFVMLLPFVWSSAQAGQPKSRHDEPVEFVFARVPEKARAAANALSDDPEAVAAGKKLFEQHCAECHGQAMEGAKRGPSLRQPRIEQATAGELFWILSNGVVRHGMPAWSKLPEPQRWQLVTFLQSRH